MYLKTTWSPSTQLLVCFAVICITLTKDIVACIIITTQTQTPHFSPNFLPLNPTWPAFSWFPLSFFSFFRYFTPSFPFFFPVSSLSRPMLLRWGKFKDLWRHEKTGEQNEHHSCRSLLESTEKKIAGKKRIKQEWSSQTGAVRLELPGWSRVDPRVRSPFCINWALWWNWCQN